VLVVVVIVAGTALGFAAPGLVPGGLGIAVVPSASPLPRPSPTPVPTASASASPAPTPSPTAPPTPTPTPALVPAPLTGVPVARDIASRQILGVMVDDHPRARPQSGFNDASVVWHAPAEGGVPRYLLLFGEAIPVSVGPVRSARPYFLAWAAEWAAVYAHVGGSPQARQLLRDGGEGQLVWDVDEFVYGPTYLWRISQRSAPHNVYTDGASLREVAGLRGAVDGSPDTPPAPVWRFEPDAPLEERAVGARLTVPYQYNTVGYVYDLATNRWLRSVTGESPQHDVADGEVVAPANVVVIWVPFRPLADGHPEKGRLEADIEGEGRAMVATNGVILQATWRKAAFDAPTELLDRQGRPIALTQGQTFVQVVPTGTDVATRQGREP
jgi:hypothetical protein